MIQWLTIAVIKLAAWFTKPQSPRVFSTRLCFQIHYRTVLSSLHALYRLLPPPVIASSIFTYVPTHLVRPASLSRKPYYQLNCLSSGELHASIAEWATLYCNCLSIGLFSLLFFEHLTYSPLYLQCFIQDMKHSRCSQIKHNKTKKWMTVWSKEWMTERLKLLSDTGDEGRALPISWQTVLPS